LVKAISGLVEKRREVYFDGAAITRTPAELISRKGLAVVPENKRLFGSMSVLENLQLGAYVRMRRNNRQEIKDDFEYVFHLFPRLRERENRKQGRSREVEQPNACHLQGPDGQTEAILMDEPSIGLAPIVVREIFKVIKGLKERGYTILLIEQNARLALKVSDRAYALELGKVVLEGDVRRTAQFGPGQELYLIPEE